jgi:hypothetical protein
MSDESSFKRASLVRVFELANVELGEFAGDDSGRDIRELA